MKQFAIILLLSVGFLWSPAFSAQKYAFVDIQYILSELPEYKTAQKEIDDLAEQWQKEIQQAYIEIDNKVQALKKEEILLPAETKKQREADIDKMRQEAQALQQKKFGVKGDLFAKRQELIEPIQNEINKAIKGLAKEKGYDFIMDKGSNGGVLFANPRYDKSDAILKIIKE